MSTITYSTARDHLAEVWDKTVSTREPVVVSRRGTESIVMLPLDEWEGLQETAHLLRSPANQRGQELNLDILYWFFLQWEKFVRDYDLKGGEEAE